MNANLNTIQCVEKWTGIMLDTSPVNMENAINAINEVYTNVLRQKCPSLYIGPVNSPYDAAVAEALLQYHTENHTDFSGNDELNEIIFKQIEEYYNNTLPFSIKELTIDNQCEGNRNPRLVLYDYFYKDVNDDQDHLKYLIKIGEVCGGWTPLNNVVIIQHRAEEIHLDDNGRLHNEHGPAIKFRGNNNRANVYAIHGQKVSVEP